MSKRPRSSFSAALLAVATATVLFAAHPMSHAADTVQVNKPIKPAPKPVKTGPVGVKDDTVQVNKPVKPAPKPVKTGPVGVKDDTVQVNKPVKPAPKPVKTGPVVAVKQ